MEIIFRVIIYALVDKFAADDDILRWHVCIQFDIISNKMKMLNKIYEKCETTCMK